MRGETQRVLVAEDNRMVSDVIRFNLRRAGFDVTVAYDGRVAAELAKTKHFDLLITDYQMPRMSGEDLCLSIRTGQQNPDVPIILCSAKGYELDLPRLTRELNISKVLYKPFSSSELIAFAREQLCAGTAGDLP